MKEKLLSDLQVERRCCGSSENEKKRTGLVVDVKREQKMRGRYIVRSLELEGYTVFRA